MDFKQFVTHWSGTHADIVSELPGIDEYVQNIVFDFWTGGDWNATIDGVVEVWFDDEAVGGAENHTSSEQQDDEVHFIRTLTASTYDNHRKYDAVEKVWVISSELTELSWLSRRLHHELLMMHPDKGSVLMERSRILRESVAPIAVGVFPLEVGGSEVLFQRVVDEIQESRIERSTRVLRTITQRIL